MSTTLFPVATFTPRALTAGPDIPDLAVGPKIDPLAVAAAVCALLGFLNATGFVAGVVLGHLVLVRIRRSNGRLRGRRLARAALFVGWTTLFLVSAVFVLMFLIGLHVTVNGG